MGFVGPPACIVAPVAVAMDRGACCHAVVCLVGTLLYWHAGWLRGVVWLYVLACLSGLVVTRGVLLFCVVSFRVCWVFLLSRGCLVLRCVPCLAMWRLVVSWRALPGSALSGVVVLCCSGPVGFMSCSVASCYVAFWSVVKCRVVLCRGLFRCFALCLCVVRCVLLRCAVHCAKWLCVASSCVVLCHVLWCVVLLCCVVWHGVAFCCVVRCSVLCSVVWCCVVLCCVAMCLVVLCCVV